MAQFNPQIPVGQDPNYFGYSKPITQPHFISPDISESGAIAKGVADTINVAVKGVDDTVKAYIGEQVYNSVEAERDKYSRTLNATKSAITGQPVDDPAHPPLSLIEQDVPQEKPPGYVNDALKSVARVQGAADAGKLSPTAYYARLNSLAKDLRAQFPGWRDYIDKKVSSITGVNPANAYISSITSDINAALKAGSDNKDSTLKFIQQHMNLDNAPQIREKYLNGEISPEDVYRSLGSQLNRKWRLEMGEANRKDIKGNREILGIATEDQMNGEAATTAVNFFDGLATLSGFTSPDKISNILTQANLGARPIDDTQAAQLGQSLAAQKDLAYRTLWRAWNTKDEKTGRTKVQDLGEGGPAKARKIIEDNLAEFDLVIKSVYDKDFGAAVYHMNQAKHILDDQRFKLYTDKNFGEYHQKMVILNKDGGPEAVQAIVKAGLMKQLPKEYKEWTNNIQLGFVTQPDLRTNGNVRTFKGAIDAARSQGIKNSAVEEDITAGNMRLFSDPKSNDNVKYNIAQAAYSPEDQNLLKRFERESTDPVTGKFKTSSYSVFNSMVNPVKTKEMKSLSDRMGKPEIWENYKNWAEKSFSSDLFSPEINDLHTIQMRGDINLIWDPKNKRFEISLIPSKVNPYTDYRGFEVAKKTINRLNSGLAGIKSIAEVEGTDVDGYILEHLIGMGYNPSQGVGTNMPEAMVNAIANPRIREMMQKKLQEQKTK